MPESLARIWLGLAAIASIGATLQVVFWPRWPSATLPSTDGLELPGYTLKPEAGSEAKRTSALAISPTTRYRLVASEAAATRPSPLTLQLAMLSPRTLVGFQLAHATKERPNWKMGQRTLQKLGNDELALGPINNRSSLQTCLTAAETGAVTEAAFAAAQQPPANLRQQLERVVGLRPNRRTDCVLVTITSAGSEQSNPAALISVYEDLRPQLKLLINP